MQRAPGFLHPNLTYTSASMKTDSNLLLDEAAEVCACMERLAGEKQAAVPLSTYRFQFHSGFQFEEAPKLVPYLAQLGVAHCYASPILKARAGSPHGYDIIDHQQLNPEIGSE